MPNFSLQLYPKTELETYMTGSERFYLTPAGMLPSVTTVLDYTKDKTWLVKWQKKVGQANAEAITKQSQIKGNTFHSLAEKYLNNVENWDEGAMALDLASFRPVQKILDSVVETVYGVELTLWSATLWLAGKTDGLIATRSGNKHIIDFKTSRRPVEEDSEKAYYYKLQATIYAMMAEEQFMTSVPYSTIIVLQENYDLALFTFKNEVLRDKAKELIKKAQAFLPVQVG